MEEKINQSSGECLLLLAAVLIMAGLGFADSDKTRISKNEIVGMCISGSGFLILLLMLIYFAYKSFKKN